MTTNQSIQDPDLIDLFFDSWRRRWGHYAWTALAQAGSVPDTLEDTDGEDYVDQVVTLAALSLLVDWFADDEDLSFMEPRADLVGEGTGISEFGFGLYAGSNDVDAYDSLGEIGVTTAVFNAVRDRVPDVARDLVAAVGEAAAFTSLWSATFDEAISLPPTSHDVDSVMNTDIVGEKGHRYARFHDLSS